MASLGAVYAAIAEAHKATMTEISGMDDDAEATLAKDTADKKDQKILDGDTAALKQVQASMVMMEYQADQQMEKQLTEVTSNKIKSDGDVAATLTGNMRG
jgi:hypothetical protein